MKPERSYRVWFTQRNGSTLLCKGLESTARAGKPKELFNISEGGSLCRQYQVTTYEELKNKLWELGSTDNGVFGIKHSGYASGMGQILGELMQLKGAEQEEIWTELFPNCKHIFLTRRNKIRQAVSWWKAIKSEVWHLEQSAVQTEKPFNDDDYDFDALSHLLRECVLRECYIENYFTANQINPLTIVYEDFILDYEGTILEILQYLGIETAGVGIAKAHYQQLADEDSEIWVQRFREDLQRGWKKKIW